MSSASSNDVGEGANEAWLSGDLLQLLLHQPRRETGEDGSVRLNNLGLPMVVVIDDMDWCHAL